ncbi:MAG: class I SAM-dependent methyltransferase [Actinomycetota bacterium]|nr:class I SAM-dependent methyltransferase [Actinomycetota bacterium]
MADDQRRYQQRYYDRHYETRGTLVREQLAHPVFRSFYDRMAARILDQVQGAAGHGRLLRVFEPGCGEGFLGSAICRVAAERELVVSYSGTDLSEAALQLARPALGDGLIVGDATEVTASVPSGSQDVVIVKNLLHHLEDPAGLLREAARVVAPAGRVVVVEARLGGPQFWLFILTSPKRERFFFHGARRNLAALDAAGLAIVHRERFSWLPYELAFHIRFGIFRRLLGTDDPKTIERISNLDKRLTSTLPWLTSYVIWVTAPAGA